MVPDILPRFLVCLGGGCCPVAAHEMAHLAVFLQRFTNLWNVAAVDILLLNPGGEFAEQPDETLLRVCGRPLFLLFEKFFHLLFRRRKPRAAQSGRFNSLIEAFQTARGASVQTAFADS